MCRGGKDGGVLFDDSVCSRFLGIALVRRSENDSGSLRSVLTLTPGLDRRQLPTDRRIPDAVPWTSKFQ